MNFSGIAKSTWLGKVLRVPLQLIPSSARVPILQGRLRGYWWVVEAGNHGYWLGSYEHEKQESFVGEIRPGAVVYDVGANVGFYTLLASELVGSSGRVVAFEPLPRNVRFLRQHLDLNKVSNAELVEVAVCDSEGEATFDDSDNSSMGHLKDDGRLRVRTVSLDACVHNGSIPPPDFLKIDVEGAEAQVLRGAVKTLREYRPTIFLATHGEDERNDCIAQLRDCGYNVCSVTGAAEAESDEFIAVPA